MKIWRRWFNYYGVLHWRFEVSLHQNKLPVFQFYLAFQGPLSDAVGVRLDIFLGWVQIDTSCFPTRGWNHDGRPLKEVGFIRGS